MKKFIFFSLLSGLLVGSSSIWAMQDDKDALALTRAPKPGEKFYPTGGENREDNDRNLNTHTAAPSGSRLMDSLLSHVAVTVYSAATNVYASPHRAQAFMDVPQRRETGDVLELCELMGETAAREKAMPSRKVGPAIDDICERLNKREGEDVPPSRRTKRVKEE